MSTQLQFKRSRDWRECLCQVPCPGCYDPREDRAPHPYPGESSFAYRQVRELAIIKDALSKAKKRVIH